VSKLESQISAQKDISQSNELKLNEFQEGNNLPCILEGKDEMIGVHLKFLSPNIKEHFVDLFVKTLLITSVEEGGFIKGKIEKTKL